MQYSWDSWTNPRYWDEILKQNEDVLLNGFSEAAAEWAESEKPKILQLAKPALSRS